MKNNIDDLFKDGLNQNEFEYNEETWQGFKELHDAEKEDDRIIPPFFFREGLILGLLILSIIGTIYFIENKNVPTDEAINQPTVNFSKKQSTQKNHRQNENTQINNTIVNKESILKNKTNPESFENSIANLNDEEAVVPTEKIIKNKEGNRNIKSSKQIQDSSIIDFATYSLKKETTKQQNPPASNRINILLPPKEKRIEIVKQIKETNTTFNNFDLLPSLNLEIHNNSYTNNLERDFNVKLKKKEKGKFFVMGAYGIGNMDSKNYTFGIGRKFVLNNYIGFNIGAAYKHIAAATLPRHRGFDTKYSRSDQTFFGNHIEADRMHFATIPLSIEVGLKRHRLNFGGSYNRLFLVKGTIYKDVRNVEEAHSAWIVETGMNLNLFSTNISYGYQLNPSTRIFLNAEMFLTDTYNTEVAVSHQFNNYNLGLKYYLNYFRKNQTLRFL